MRIGRRANAADDRGGTARRSADREAAAGPRRESQSHVEPGAESSPLLEASLAGDAEIMQALLDHGAGFKDIAGFALASAAGADCMKCIDLLVARNLDAMQYTIALGQVVVLDNPIWSG